MIKNDANDIFKSSHLTVLISYAIFSAVLIGESLIMGWEFWMILLIAVSNVICWILHIQHDVPDNVRIWIYSILMSCTYFFYGIHLTSTFDLALVMAAIILIFTTTGKKGLITLCQFTYLVTMTYEVVQLVMAHETFDALMITRLILHFFMVLFISQFSKTFIDRCVPRYTEIKNKDFYFIITAADTDKEIMEKVIESLRGFTRDCLENAHEKGIIYGLGVWQSGDVKRLPALTEAYEMGKGV